MRPLANSASRSRYTASGTHSHLSSTAKQTVATVLAADFGGFGRVLIEIDCFLLTKNSTIFAIEGSTDGGVSWAPVTGSSMTASAAQHFSHEFGTSNSFRVMLTSGSAEGVTRSVPWKVHVY